MAETRNVMLQADELIQNIPSQLANLQSNQQYAQEVGSFVASSYAGVVSDPNADAEKKRHVADTAATYASQSLEAIAEHVQNMSSQLTQLMEWETLLLDDVAKDVASIAHVSGNERMN